MGIRCLPGIIAPTGYAGPLKRTGGRVGKETAGGNAV
jgi:hypothetical protein